MEGQYTNRRSEESECSGGDYNSGRGYESAKNDDDDDKGYQ